VTFLETADVLEQDKPDGCVNSFLVCFLFGDFPAKASKTCVVSMGATWILQYLQHR